MPIPGTEGLGQVILTYMTAQKKACCDCKGICSCVSGHQSPTQDSRECRPRDISTSLRRPMSGTDYAVERARMELCRLLGNTEIHHDVVIEKRLEEITSLYPRVRRMKSATKKRLPLHVVVQKKAPLCILEHLVSCHPRALVTQDGCGDTPLNLACKRYHCDPAILQLLACPGAVTIKDEGGNTVLHNYFQADSHYTVDLQIVQDLVNACPENLKVQGLPGRNTPLHVAVHLVNTIDALPVIRFLAESCPEAIRMKDRKGIYAIGLIVQAVSSYQF